VHPSPWRAAPAAILLAAPTAAVTVFPPEPPILVSARTPLTALDIGASVTLVDRADLDRLQQPLLVDVLRLQPGVSFSRNGGPGGFTAVRLRGAEGEQTVLVVDGVKLADVASPGGGADFAGVATAGIARVEILRGPQSLAWGSQAIGGVIAIETEAPGGQMLRGSVEGGSRASLNASAEAGADLGRASVRLGGSWQQTDGISAFAESRGGAERDDFRTRGASARLDVALADGLIVDVRGRLQDSEFGVDGFPPPDFRLADTPDRGRSRDASGAIGLRFSSGGFNGRAGWQLADTARRSWTPGTRPETSFRSTGRAERLDAQGSWEAARWLTLAGGLEREVTRLETASPSAFDPSPDPFRARATIGGGFAQAVLRPTRDVTLLAGVRHDEHDRFGGATTFAASGSAWLPGAPVRLKASYGEGFKAPTLFQLFSDFGNPALQPERATGWDAGIAVERPAITASATWFERRTRNQIDFVSCLGSSSAICVDRPFGTYDNVARSRARGLELAAVARPAEWLRAEAQISWTEARNRTAGSPNEGRALARRPEVSAAVLVDVLMPGWQAGATVSHVSASFDDGTNSRRIPGHVLVDLRGAVPLGRQLELTARVSNLFDERYETASFYGQPGRQVFVGLRARL
jgi:vitamin B12 transporter